MEQKLQSAKSVSEKLDALHSELQEMKKTLRELNIKAARLNIDLVSTIDPKDVHQLEENERICNDCFKRFEQRYTKIDSVNPSHDEIMKVEVVVQKEEHEQ